jgi:hypothetical protein
MKSAGLNNIIMWQPSKKVKTYGSRSKFKSSCWKGCLNCTGITSTTSGRYSFELQALLLERMGSCTGITNTNSGRYSFELQALLLERMGSCTGLTSTTNSRRRWIKKVVSHDDVTHVSFDDKSSAISSESADVHFKTFTTIVVPSSGYPR